MAGFVAGLAWGVFKANLAHLVKGRGNLGVYMNNEKKIDVIIIQKIMEFFIIWPTTLIDKISIFYRDDDKSRLFIGKYYLYDPRKRTTGAMAGLF